MQLPKLNVSHSLYSVSKLTCEQIKGHEKRERKKKKEKKSKKKKKKKKKKK